MGRNRPLGAESARPKTPNTPRNAEPAPNPTSPGTVRENEPMRTVTITVHGRVQGVGFRYALHAAAQRAGARGWVRNRRDGTVEALIAGDAATVDAVIAWAHDGPPSARVERVDAADSDETAPEGFEIRATA